jgi:hypothetical protein
MVEKINSFTPGEITLGHILPTGVVIDKWLTQNDDHETIFVFLTAAGMGYGFERSDMVSVLGTVSMEILSTLRNEFSANYTAATGDDMEFLAEAK